MLGEESTFLAHDIIRDLSLGFLDGSSLARFSRTSATAFRFAGMLAKRRFKLETEEDDALLATSGTQMISNTAAEAQATHTAIAAIAHAELRAELCVDGRPRFTLALTSHAIVSAGRGW